MPVWMAVMVIVAESAVTGLLVVMSVASYILMWQMLILWQWQWQWLGCLREVPVECQHMVTCSLARQSLMGRGAPCWSWGGGHIFIWYCCHCELCWWMMRSWGGFVYFGKVTCNCICHWHSCSGMPLHATKSIQGNLPVFLHMSIIISRQCMREFATTLHSVVTLNLQKTSVINKSIRELFFPASLTPSMLQKESGLNLCSTRDL